MMLTMLTMPMMRIAAASRVAAPARSEPPGAGILDLGSGISTPINQRVVEACQRRDTTRAGVEGCRAGPGPQGRDVCGGLVHEQPISCSPQVRVRVILSHGVFRSSRASRFLPPPKAHLPAAAGLTWTPSG